MGISQHGHFSTVISLTKTVPRLHVGADLEAGRFLQVIALGKPMQIPLTLNSVWSCKKWCCASKGPCSQPRLYFWWVLASPACKYTKLCGADPEKRSCKCLILGPVELITRSAAWLGRDQGTRSGRWTCPRCADKHPHLAARPASLTGAALRSAILGWVRDRYWQGGLLRERRSEVCLLAQTSKICF